MKIDANKIALLIFRFDFGSDLEMIAGTQFTPVIFRRQEMY